MIRKFRSIDEMKANRWREPGDPMLPTVWRGLWERGQATIKRPLVPGVYKHRTIEEAKAQKERWADERRRL